MGANVIDAGGLWIEIKKNFCIIFLQSVGMRRQNNFHQRWLRQTRYLLMMNRTSGHQNRQIR